MTTMKSLEKRLKNIPEPDLARYQSEKWYRFLEQFSRERLYALREVFCDADEAGRTPTVKEAAAALGRSIEEFAAAFGISTPKADTKSQSERNATPVGGAAAANHDREAAKAAVTRPTRRRPRGS